MRLKGILFLLICLVLHCEAQKPKDVLISGILINLHNRITVMDVSEIGALRPSNNDREIYNR